MSHPGGVALSVHRRGSYFRTTMAESMIRAVVVQGATLIDRMAMNALRAASIVLVFVGIGGCTQRAPVVASTPSLAERDASTASVPDRRWAIAGSSCAGHGVEAPPASYRYTEQPVPQQHFLAPRSRWLVERADRRCLARERHTFVLDRGASAVVRHCVQPVSADAQEQPRCVTGITVDVPANAPRILDAAPRTESTRLRGGDESRRRLLALLGAARRSPGAADERARPWRTRR